MVELGEPSLGSAARFCGECGTSIVRDAAFCGTCGSAQESFASSILPSPPPRAPLPPPHPATPAPLPPLRAASLPPAPSRAPALDGPPAEFADRVVAGLIDGAIVVGGFIAAFVLSILLFAMGLGALGGVLVVAAFASILLYMPLMAGRSGPRNGQTIGRQVANIRVVPDEGEPMSLGRAMSRELLFRFLLILHRLISPPAVRRRPLAAVRCAKADLARHRRQDARRKGLIPRHGLTSGSRGPVADFRPSGARPWAAWRPRDVAPPSVSHRKERACSITSTPA